MLGFFFFLVWGRCKKVKRFPLAALSSSLPKHGGAPGKRGEPLPPREERGRSQRPLGPSLPPTPPYWPATAPTKLGTLPLCD
jgi:hypothetical protein